jgi:hypothetical protein
MPYRRLREIPAGPRSLELDGNIEI